MLLEVRLDAPVLRRQRFVRADVDGLRSPATGQSRDARAVRPGHGPGERKTCLGVERRGIAVVVASEWWAGWRRALRDDRRAQPGEQLHEEGAEPALRHLSTDRQRTPRLQL